MPTQDTKIVQLTSTGLWEDGTRIPSSGAGIADMERRAAELRAEGWRLAKVQTGTWTFERAAGVRSDGAA